MKKTIVLLVFAGMFAMQGCKQKSDVQMDGSDAGVANISKCDVRFNGVSFTGALNGADTCVAVKGDSILEFSCAEKRDFFRDPNGAVSDNAPILLSAIDNTKPFTFTAKITPGFTKEGTYNAADIFIYANDTLWHKLAFEQDERGNHRIVTVRTIGTSDDNNHEKLDSASVYLRFSSDTRTLASYYSFDKKEWYMVRLYKNNYPDSLWVGISSQCPKTGICKSVFEDISLEQKSVTDFRMGN